MNDITDITAEQAEHACNDTHPILDIQKYLTLEIEIELDREEQSASAAAYMAHMCIDCE